MTYPVTIVAMVVDAHNLTMYKTDGDTITIPQGDPRLRDLVAKMAPVLDAGDNYLLTSEDMDGKNHYAETEKKTNGLIRFFKMAKSKFKEIAEKFCEPVAPVAKGKVPVMEHTVSGAVEEEVTFMEEPEPVKPKLPPENERPLTQGLAAVAEIMANATPSSDKDFASVVSAEQAEKTGAEEEIVVAVTSDNTVVHGVEQLADQMKAVSAGVTSGEGMARFLERAASVKRGHSVEDLLKFVQKGELPFADDGTVLVYKRLKPGNKDGVFVDVYSGKVEQSLGSFVHMAANLVDARRSVDCSNGLHVARRDYLHAFSGDVVVLCKLAPEHVIAVPTYDARKLRAMGYHIIAQLNDEDARLVCRNQPMKDTELLANAIAGNHLPILEYVEITESMGGGLKVTKVESPEQHAASQVRAVSSLDEVPEVTPEASEVDARALALDLAKPGTKDTTVQATWANGELQKVDQLITAPPGGYADGDSYRQPAEPLGEAKPVPAPAKRTIDVLVSNWNRALSTKAKLDAATELMAFKKQSKKSWTALGVPVTVYDAAAELIAKNAAEESLPKVVPPNDVKQFPAKAKGKRKEVKPTVPTDAPVRSTPIDRKAEAAQAKPVKEKKMTQAEEMAKLVALYNANPDKMNARAIFALKQKSKKSWETLGVADKAFQKKITERAKL